MIDEEINILKVLKYLSDLCDDLRLKSKSQTNFHSSVCIFWKLNFDYIVRIYFMILSSTEKAEILRNSK